MNFIREKGSAEGRAHRPEGGRRRAEGGGAGIGENRHPACPTGGLSHGFRSTSGMMLALDDYLQIADKNAL